MPLPLLQALLMISNVVLPLLCFTVYPHTFSHSLVSTSKQDVEISTTTEPVLKIHDNDEIKSQDNLEEEEDTSEHETQRFVMEEESKFSLKRISIYENVYADVIAVKDPLDPSEAKKMCFLKRTTKRDLELLSLMICQSLGFPAYKDYGPAAQEMGLSSKSRYPVKKIFQNHHSIIRATVHCSMHGGVIDCEDELVDDEDESCFLYAVECGACEATTRVLPWNTFTREVHSPGYPSSHPGLVCQWDYYNINRDIYINITDLSLGQNNSFLEILTGDDETSLESAVVLRGEIRSITYFISKKRMLRLVMSTGSSDSSDLRGFRAQIRIPSNYR